MLLAIISPDVTRRLQRAALDQGISPTALVEEILEHHLPSAIQGDQTDTAPPTSGLDSLKAPERIALFLNWIESNRSEHLPMLPPEAFERASFYEDERHQKPGP